MNNIQELKLDIGFANLVVGIGNQPNMFPEVYIALADKDGNIIQDIALARPQGVSENPDATNEEINKTIECLIWTDEYTDNHTHKYEIKMYEEDENNG